MAIRQKKVPTRVALEREDVEQAALQLREAAAGLRPAALGFADAVTRARGLSLARERRRSALGLSAWQEDDGEQNALVDAVRVQVERRRKIAVHLEREQAPRVVVAAGQFVLYGRVVDRATGLGLQGLGVCVFGRANQVIVEGVTGAGGSFRFRFGPEPQAGDAKQQAAAGGMDTASGACLPDEPAWVETLPARYGIAVVSDGVLLHRDRELQRPVPGTAVRREIAVTPPSPKGGADKPRPKPGHGSKDPQGKRAGRATRIGQPKKRTDEEKRAEQAKRAEVAKRVEQAKRAQEKAEPEASQEREAAKQTAKPAKKARTVKRATKAAASPARRKKRSRKKDSRG